MRILETEQNAIVKEEEEKWRLWSRALWLSSGDKNTRYFHKLASHNRVRKHIWQIKNGQGDIVTEQESIKDATVNYYKDFYKSSIVLSPLEQFNVMEFYPQMINEEDANTLFTLFTLEDVKAVLFSFKKEKISGPDGWTTELFTFFFNLVGEDVLAMVEETRSLGAIIIGLNSMFMTLIPTENNPSSFDDCRPISLCNLCYKII